MSCDMQNCPEGSVLIGTISYGKVSSAVSEEGKKPNKNPTAYLLSYIVPPPKVNEPVAFLSEVSLSWLIGRYLLHFFVEIIQPYHLLHFQIF